MVTRSNATIEISISIQETLFKQAEALAQQLHISQGQLFESAIENFIRNYQNPTPPDEINAEIDDAKRTVQIGAGRRVIHRGDVYWVQLENSSELDAAIPHPYVIIQDDLFNHSRINTVVACALTSNIKRANYAPGNVLLEVGEANLPKQSVVEVSKVSTLDKTALGEYVGSLTEQRVDQILAGMRFLQMTFFAR